MLKKILERLGKQLRLIRKEKNLNSNFITWIRPLITDVINSVYNEMAKSESISMEKFYKRVGNFDKLITKINDLRYDRDDWSLKQKFKLDNL